MFLHVSSFLFEIKIVHKSQNPEKLTNNYLKSNEFNFPEFPSFSALTLILLLSYIIYNCII